MDQYQTSGSVIHKSDCIRPVSEYTLEAQLPIYWVPVLKSLYTFIRSITQGPTTWAPGLLGIIGSYAEFCILLFFPEPLADMIRK